MFLGPIFRAMLKNKAVTGLLIVEVTFTLIIIITSLNLISGARATINRPSGVVEENVLALQIQSPEKKYLEDRVLEMETQKDLQFIRSQPGVLSAAVVNYWPLRGGGSLSNLKLPEQTADQSIRSVIFYCSGEIIKTLGLELVEGRDLADSDLPPYSGEDPKTKEESSTPLTPIVVTQKMADALFPNGNALGQTMITGSTTTQIVGIVSHMYNKYGMDEELEQRITFFPARIMSSDFCGILIKTEPDVFEDAYTRLESTFQAKYPNRIFSTQSMVELRELSIVGQRIFSKLLTILMVLLVFITAIGIYGMASFSVSKRRSQIGIRRALGAKKVNIIQYFLTEMGLIAIFGSIIGLILSFVINTILRGTLGSTPPMTIGITVISLCMVFSMSLLATLAPSIRATRIPPIVASKVGKSALS